MSAYETSATVEGQGVVSISGVPFAAGTQVQIAISPLVTTDQAATESNGPALAAARARMQELFHTVRGFCMTPKIPREELYDRRGLR
jgi:hypothetical protein